MPTDKSISKGQELPRPISGADEQSMADVQPGKVTSTRFQSSKSALKVDRRKIIVNRGMANPLSSLPCRALHVLQVHLLMRLMHESQRWTKPKFAALPLCW